ncbi:hypothetical protein DERF_008760 [Dermatophagoides farinae]|uniref:Uncharacterized protein n=1 Tax=Dermatophagoides farinae TaxID=6954 RepID=A0A922I2B1_DERFA|nr:hypothetical protein DERF_008760 [Dermatophagoides farinae]
MPLNSSSSSKVEAAYKETHSVVCSFDKAFFHCSSSAHFAADFASNRWCSPSIEHRKKNGAFTILQKATAVDDSMLSVFLR